MPKSLDQWCESLLYVASEAWAESSGHDSGDWDHVTRLSCETGSNEKGWPSAEFDPEAEDADLFIEPNLDRAASQAGHAFRAGQFAEVVLLLDQHEARLSKKLKTMLEAARAKEAGDP